MYRRFFVKDYIIFGLCAFGILVGLVNNPAAFLIPIIVLGGVFLLYKYLPGGRRSSRANRPSRSTVYTMKPKRKKKASPFRVIPGNKEASDDEPPKYH